MFEVTKELKSHTLTIPLEKASIVTSARDELVLHTTTVSNRVYILLNLVALGCE
jgi:hypothetical protein